VEHDSPEIERIDPDPAPHLNAGGRSQHPGFHRSSRPHGAVRRAEKHDGISAGVGHHHGRSVRRDRYPRQRDEKEPVRRRQGQPEAGQVPGVAVVPDQLFAPVVDRVAEVGEHVLAEQSVKPAYTGQRVVGQHHRRDGNGRPLPDLQGLDHRDVADAVAAGCDHHRLRDRRSAEPLGQPERDSRPRGAGVEQEPIGAGPGNRHRNDDRSAVVDRERDRFSPGRARRLWGEAGDERERERQANRKRAGHGPHSAARPRCES
jgi:hypothetical protein